MARRLLHHILRRVCQPQVARIFIVFGVVYLLTFCLILPLLLYKIKYSAYYFATKDYSKDIETEVRLNTHEVDKANDWIRDQTFAGRNKLHSSDFVMTPNTLQVLIVIISVKRDKIDGYDPQYLTRTVSRTFEVMREFEQTSKLHDFFGLLLCNVDPSPESYSELNRLSVDLNIPVVARFDKSSPTVEESDNHYFKEQTDYSYCLRQALELTPQYVLVLEDDAVPRPDALHVVHHILTYQLKYYSKEEDNGPLGFIKFYHPYRFMSRIHWSELAGFSSLFGTLVFLLYVYFFPRSVERHIYMYYVAWFLSVLYVFLIGWVLGQANLLKLRHISKYLYTVLPSHNCCTPAMFFSRASGHLFVQYYADHPSRTKAMDILLEQFLKDTKTRGLMVMPNSFDHIGMYSVVKMNIKHRELVN